MRTALRSSIRALLIATLITLAFSASALAQEDATGQLGPESQAIAAALNDVRAQNGLPALRVNALLNKAAQDHVNDLIANNMYGHYGSDGSSVRTRVARTGYPSSWVSENWVTSSSPGGAMTWWMNDWIHRVNILESHWDEVGIGAGQVSNGYWIYVTDFANSGGQAAPAPVASAPAAAPAPVEAAVPAGGMDYTIRGGDTLLAIGLRFDIEWQDIAVANGMSEQTLLQVGKVIRLPGAAAANVAATADLPAGGLLYTVSPGDTLSSIAGRHAIAWQDVAAANGISDPSLLQVGMQLRLPGVPEEGASAEPAEAPAAVAEDAAETTEPTEPAEVVSEAYVVKPGDTLSGIAGRSGITWQELAAFNGLGTGAVLQIGQALQLPLTVAPARAATVAEAPATEDAATTDAEELLQPASPVAINYTTELLNATVSGNVNATLSTGGTGGALAAGSLSTAATYTVKSGDTIISIAIRNNINWKRLLEINGLTDDSLLQPGQILTLE
jgi:LysM repeat protein